MRFQTQRTFQQRRTRFARTAELLSESGLLDIAIRTANLARENRYLKVSCPCHVLLAYERDLKVMVGITLVFVPRICCKLLNRCL